MCSPGNTLPPILLNERDHVNYNFTYLKLIIKVWAYSKVKYNDKNPLHYQMLYSVYCNLKHTDVCPKYGNHWESIGF